MSKSKDKTPDLSRIVNRARRQGHLTIDEMAKMLPDAATIDDTSQLIESLQDLDLPVLERKPGAKEPQRAHKPARNRNQNLLTREQEVELSRQITRGQRRGLSASFRSPLTVKAVIIAYKKVASGKSRIWDILTDYESSHIDQDELEAQKRLKVVADDLDKHMRQLNRLKSAREQRKADSSTRRRNSAIRRAMTAKLMRLRFHDSFINQLLKPLTAESAKVRKALNDLSSLERELELQADSLGGTDALEDSHIRQMIDSLEISRQERTRAKNATKNIKRILKAASRKVGLPGDEILEVAKEIKAGIRSSDRARHTLVESNQRLVVSIARRYPQHNLDFLDLVQEGNLGLMRAADRFDPDRGFRFGTYATWWVRQSIGRLLAEQGSAVRIPPHVQESLQKIRRITRRSVLKTGAEPSVEELAELMEKTPDRIKEILSAGRKPVSTDIKVGDSQDSATLLDFIPDPKATPDEQADRRVQQAVLQDSMSALSQREQEIVVLRFIEGLTLQEIGERYGITRERTRQLQEQALMKLKKRLKADLLRRLLKDNRSSKSARASRKKTHKKRKR